MNSESFEALLDRACKKLYPSELHWTFKKIDELEGLLINLEVELDEMLKDHEESPSNCRYCKYYE